MIFPKAEEADIALLLEGTFPYISGGVSSWVNQIIRAYPEYRFAIIFLGSRREDYGEPKYALPDNVVHLEAHYIYETDLSNVEPKATSGDAKAIGLSACMHDSLMPGHPVENAMGYFRQVAREIVPGGSLKLEDFLYCQKSWDVICDRYCKFCSDPSFVDYFWTVRIMHLPLWKLAEVAQNMPRVKALHAVSTGYAGFLGALTHQARQIPLILSEHGIYTKERKIDLFKSEWIRDNRNVFQRDPTELSYYRQTWIHLFEWLGRFCYDAADPIIALYEANRLRQVSDGAVAERTFNIPNGISLSRFAPLRDQRPDEVPKVLCLIGRVVPIKDIKTFIRAMRTVVNQMPEAEGWIAGPEDEDQSYAEECHNLVRSLGLQDNVRFLGFQRVEALMPKIGLTILSSISEALPLVILEGYAAGVPTVSTDVGSCRQLVEGLDGEDQALGVSGAIVKIADPQGLAEAALRFLNDPAVWLAASQSGIARVERYYTDSMMFARYRAVYEKALGQQGEAG